MRFNDIFREWADKYDETVSGHLGEYGEVFAGYEEMFTRIVQALAIRPGERVLEIGVGTGNLTAHLLRAGWDVCGIDPSPEMRAIAIEKLGYPIGAGHFLELPEGPFHGIASSFAFHHLTDEEKGTALRLMRERLRPEGRIAIVDTVFEDEDAKNRIHERARSQGYQGLLNDLQTEYYPLLGVVRDLFHEAGLTFSAEPLNLYAWLLVGSSQNK